MKKNIALLLLLISTLSFAQKKPTKSNSPLIGIETQLEKALADQQAAGFAVAVVKNGEIIYSKGFGFSDYENKKKVTPNTLFAIGSCTKAFTASLMGVLNQEGKLDYDELATKYLPALHFFKTEMDNNITVRDMMSHRTGLPRHDLSWYFFISNSRDSLLQRIKYMEPTEPLRQKWQYNNFMFLVQGMITEKLTGKTWEQNIKEKIFDPLGMKTSNLSIVDLQKNNLAAFGYGLYKDSLIKKLDYYPINAMGPAGSINSSVNEMANWVNTWIYGGKFNGKEIIPASYVKEAISSQMVVGAALPDTIITDAYFANYGFGWMLSSYRGHYRVEHGGNIDGFSASTSFFPTDSIGVVVLTNQDKSSLPGIVRNIIADRLLGLSKIDWNKRAVDAQNKAKETAKAMKENINTGKKIGTTPTLALKEYEGLYNNLGYGTAEMALKNDSLFMLAPVGNFWLKHYQYDVFEVYYVDKKDGIDTSDQSSLRVQFFMNGAGEISYATMPLQAGLEDLKFIRSPKAKAMSKETLDKYVGEYEFAPGAGVKFYIKGESLYAFIEGQPEYELVPIDKNKFSLKVLPGYSVQFDEGDNNAIIAASFIQPNGTFKANRKK